MPRRDPARAAVTAPRDRESTATPDERQALLELNSVREKLEQISRFMAKELDLKQEEVAHRRQGAIVELHVRLRHAEVELAVI